MTKRIFRSICAVAISVFIASIALFMGVLYDYFSDIQCSQLRMQTELASQGVADEGLKFFNGLDTEEYRITWIDVDGTVLYDSKSDTIEMENHLEREEIKQAISEGMGESSRYSSTLLKRFFYCAKLLPNGTVLRLSIAQNTLMTLLLGMIQPICAICLVAVILSLVLASRLSKKIVKPLNEINLDDPMNNDGYDELTPLLRRIDKQHRQIKKQSEELYKKQVEFETVTTGMAEGIVLLNFKGDILSINPTATHLLETDNYCVGNNILTVNHSLKLQELLIKAFDGKYTEKIISINGGTYQFDASPVISDGEVSGIVLLMLDVTEKEKSEQIRREFTANVSHELKTPLQTISGSAELLANGMVKENDIKRFSTRIYSESQRMIRLVDDIIKLSHLDAGADDMKKVSVNLYLLAKETINTLSAAAESANVTFNLNGKNAEVYGIPQLLHGIIYNLYDNAIKYNRNGGTVDVFVKNEKNSVIFSVADTGIGISSEHIERIFERFYRVDKSRSKEIGGTGLGLSIVKHSARLHNASIKVQSEVNVGTTITVVFPSITAN